MSIIMVLKLSWELVAFLQAKIRCATVGHKRQNTFKHMKPTESFKIINEEAKHKQNENQLNVVSLKQIGGDGLW